MIQVSGIFTGGGSGALVDVIRAEVLPPTVVNGQLVILTDIPALIFTLGYNLPASPAAGDIWVHTVDNGFYPVTASDGVRTIILTPGAVLQYVSGAWVYREAYVGVGGQWRMCSTHSPLNDLPAQALIAIAESGEDMSTFFEIGDQRNVQLTTSEIVPMEIVGFAHDDLADASGKAAITLCSVNCLASARVFHPVNTAMRWNGYELSVWLNGDFFNSVPLDLREGIRTVSKRCRADPASSVVENVSQKVSLPSCHELNLTPAAPVEGTSYPRFTNDASRVKRLGINVGSWWTRSTTKISSVNQARFISGTGTAVDSSLPSSSGVAPLFCVGRVGV